MSNLEDMEKNFQKDVDSNVKELNKTIFELKKEVAFLKKVIRDNELEIDGLPQLSDEEFICLEQIERLKEASDNMAFDKEQAEIFDKLIKALNIIRNSTSKLTAKKKTSKNVAELISIAKGKNA